MAVYYLKSKKLSSSAVRCILLFIWVIPMVLFSPWLQIYAQHSYELPSGHQYVACTATYSSGLSQKLFTLFVLFITCYLLPLAVIAVLYLLIGRRVWRRTVRGLRGQAMWKISRAKIRIIRMLVVVVVVFAFSWMPLYVIQLRIDFGPSVGEVERKLLAKLLIPAAQWLGTALNSCINPFIYVYFSENFRQSIVAVFQSRSCCSTIHV